MSIPRELARQLANGDVVLFCGAGISTSPGGLPSGRQLACELAARARLGDVCSWSLAEVAQAYETQLGRQSLIAYVADRLEQPHHLPLRIHDLIAELPFREIITTNWDDLIEESLRQHGKPFTKVVRDEEVAYASRQRTMLIKLHGSVEQKDTLVVTDDDCYRMFGRLPEMLNLIRTFFATKTMLFLGFGLADEDFRRLYYEMASHIGRHIRRAYAVQLGPTELAIRYWDTKNVQVIDSDAVRSLEALSVSLSATP